jgi:hypothetical protein
MIILEKSAVINRVVVLPADRLIAVAVKYNSLEGDALARILNIVQFKENRDDVYEKFG